MTKRGRNKQESLEIEENEEMDMEGEKTEIPDKEPDQLIYETFQNDPITLSYITQSNYHLKKYISLFMLKVYLVKIFQI